jgi:multidrug efflux pump subunit AcrA (membrane-fusion protein)
MWRKVGLPLLAALVLVGWSVWNVFGVSPGGGRHDPPPDKLVQSPYPDALAGLGIVEPSTEASGSAMVSVGTQVPGVVTQVYVKVGQHVRQGEPLFGLDERQLRAELVVRQAKLTAARAQLDRLDQMPRQEDIPPSEAQVAQAKAEWVAAADRAERARQLAPKGALAAEDLVRAEQALEAARAKLDQARADDARLKAGAWAPDRAIAQAAVDQARAAVDQTGEELKLLVVRAPIDGDVLQVNVRPGEAVAAQPGPGLIVMGDVSTIYVRVSIDEQNIPQFRLHAPGKAYRRGATQEALPLRFVRVEPYVVPKKSLTGDNPERVDTRVMEVIYAIDLPQPTVMLGQQVDVFLSRADPAGSDQSASYAAVR